MGLGLFGDKNLALLAAVSEGTWSVALPLANIITGDRFLTRPARQLTPATLANSTFAAALDRSRRINLVGLMFHTLSRSALFRLTVAAAGGTLAAPAYQSDWTPVFPRLYSSAELDWSEPNWWTGQALEEDLDLYPRHRWMPLPAAIVASAVRIELDDHTNAAGYFDIGGLWISDTWTPAFNFERGRERGREVRDQRDETASGRLLYDRRTGRRVLNVSWAGLTDLEANRLTDAAARTAGGRGVVFIPDADDPVSMTREAMLAEVEVKGPKLTYSYLNTASVTLKEIVA